MKKLLTLLLMLNSFAFCITLDDLTKPRPMHGRVSLNDEIESSNSNLKINEQKAKLMPSIPNKTETSKAIAKTTETQPEKTETEAKAKTKTADLTYADLSLKRLADDVSYELDLDANKINSDLSILWAAVTQNSETMKYTIYKLSNPDEDKPSDSAIKKILKPIANFSSVAGASVAGDPYVATTALIGGGILNAMMKDDKEYNYKFSKVSDTDMVILVRKISELQNKLLDLYFDYRTKQKLASMEQENFKKREELYETSQNKSKEELIIADVNYRNAKAKTQKAQDEYITSRAILENLVGLDALNKIEQD